ncbi:MAG: ABC transporter ATP-binding protein [Candidatus Aminicenantaceae bacterium]
MAQIVELDNVRKTYGSVKAVDGVSFEIEKGDVFGLLGPNGAGKTTTVEMIEGLRKPDTGIIRVNGLEVSKGIGAIREILGVQLQTTSLPEMLRVEETLKLFASYYQKSLPVDDVLREVVLDDKRRSFVKELSGGQNQRLALALALINDPAILILDEPTTGLDPQARRNMWEIIERMRERGKTLILTTHYMEEAERLCNRVGIIDHGKIIALDTPDTLIAKQKFSAAVELKTSAELDLGKMQRLADVTEVIKKGETTTIYTKKAHKVLIELARMMDRQELDVENISMRRATLEDVFLDLTGRSLRE